MAGYAYVVIVRKKPWVTTVLTLILLQKLSWAIILALISYEARNTNTPVESIMTESVQWAVGWAVLL